MISSVRTLGAFLFLGVFGSLALGDAKEKTTPEKYAKERASFLPKRKFEPLPGKVVGILVQGGDELMSAEGRTGPNDALCFSTGEGSYSWIYVPVKERPLIGALLVPVGNGELKRFDKLGVANLKTVAQWGIKEANVLVEVEVNGGLGSAKGESFVATHMRVVEASKEFPFKIADLIARAREHYASFLQGKEAEINTAMNEAKTRALPDGKTTGPREKSELVFVGFRPQTQHLVIRLKTKVTDGAYKTAKIKEPVLKIGSPIAVLEEKEVRYGKSFGVELGMAYEVVPKSGKIERSLELPLELFEKDLPPPASLKGEARTARGTIQ